MGNLIEKPSPLRRGGWDVLIVVNDPGETDLLTTTLELAGYHVAGVAGSGAEGIARMQRRRFDLVVWDATLPDLKHLARGRRPALVDVPPLLFLITCDYLHTLLPELGRRRDDYVTKPVRTTEVLARAGSCCGAGVPSGTRRDPATATCCWTTRPARPGAVPGRSASPPPSTGCCATCWRTRSAWCRRSRSAGRSGASSGRARPSRSSSPD